MTITIIPYFMYLETNNDPKVQMIFLNRGSGYGSTFDLPGGHGLRLKKPR